MQYWVIVCAVLTEPCHSSDSKQHVLSELVLTFCGLHRRYYIVAGGMCHMRMVDAEFEYTYEYQGNAAKLVHTPLTDKCYLTLTQGKSLCLSSV